MSASAHLYINAKYTSDDIYNVLKTVGARNVNYNQTNIATMLEFCFEFENVKDYMFMHLHHHLPTGNVILLSMGSYKEAINLMLKIAYLIGGIFEENDCIGQCTIMQGDLDENDNLLYFIKRATLKGKMPNGTIKELNDYIHEWSEKISKCDEKYDLYPKNRKVNP